MNELLAESAEPKDVVSQQRHDGEETQSTSLALQLRSHTLFPLLPPLAPPQEWTLDPEEDGYVPPWFPTDMTWPQWSIAPPSPINGSSDLFTLLLLTGVYKKYYLPYMKHSHIPPHPRHNFYTLPLSRTAWKHPYSSRHPLNLYIWDSQLREKFEKEKDEEGKWEALKEGQKVDYSLERRLRKGVYNGFETIKTEDEEDVRRREERKAELEIERDDGYKRREKERRLREKKRKCMQSFSPSTAPAPTERLDLQPLASSSSLLPTYNIPIPEGWMEHLTTASKEMQALIDEQNRRLSFKPKDKVDVDMTTDGAYASREPSAFPTTPGGVGGEEWLDGNIERGAKKRKLSRRTVSVAPEDGDVEERDKDAMRVNGKVKEEDDSEGPSALKHKVNRSWWGMVHRIPGKAYLLKDNFLESLMHEDWSDKPHLQGDNAFKQFDDGSWDMENTRVVGMDENWWWGPLKDPDVRKREVWASRRLSRGQSLAGLEPLPDGLGAAEDGKASPSTTIASAHEPEFDPLVPHSMVPVISNGQYVSGTIVPFSTPRVVPLKQKIGEALGIKTDLSERARRGEGTVEELRGRKPIYSRRPPEFDNGRMERREESSNASTPTTISGYGSSVPPYKRVKSKIPPTSTSMADNRPTKKRKT
ncbi:hypothetical protein BT69DRAFT_1345022 [Atractiella rhizophila]|nr:hypothetical protein BT69DRAFT_1345022 [Atractiella rhizophila]